MLHFTYNKNGFNVFLSDFAFIFHK